MWVKCLWMCLVTSAVVVSTQRLDMPKGLSRWPLHRFSFENDKPVLEQEYDGVGWRNKRTGPSLSVANPIEVLRNRLMLEIARRRLQKQDESQVLANREFLKSVGKRQVNVFRTDDGDDLKSFDYQNTNGETNWETS